MLKNLTLAAASIVVALFLAEIGLRVAGISYPSFYEEDRDLGGKLRPGAEGWFRAEGGSYVRINSDGMRDREHTVAKPPGTIRIAVLGDSFAEAMAVPEEKTFWAVLERELSRCSALQGRKVEVLNFGVSGYGTGQELLMLRHHAWKYDPDIVLLAFFTGNDVRNNFAALNQDPKVPYFVYQGDRLVLDNSFRDTLRSLKLSPRAARFSGLMAGLRNHSRVLQLLSEARTLIGRRAQIQKVQASDDMASSERSAAQGGEIGLDNAVYSPPRDAQWKEAWRVTDGLLLLMRDEVRAHGAQFWIVTLSTGIQVHPDPAVRAAFMKRLGVDTLLYPDLRIQALAEREHIPAITLAPAMAAYAESHKTYLHGFRNASLGFGHWNQEGNRLAGELIAERLCAAWGKPAASAYR